MRLDIWNYRVVRGSAMVTGYHGEGPRAEVPEKLDGFPVKIVGEMTFRNHGELTEIILPDTLTAIDGGAFADCSALTALHIPNGVTRIGDRAFAGCGRLFALNLPEGLKKLGGAALEDCDTLPLIYVPDSLDAAALKADPFAGFAGRIALKEDHPTLRMVDGVLMSRDGRMLIHYPLGRTDQSYTVPQGVERILKYAFCRAKFMAVRVPDSVRVLEAATFLDCERLMTLRISEDCEASEDAALGCGRLEKRLRRIGAISMD